MKKTILKYGLISSGILVVLMSISMAFNKHLSYDMSLCLGYGTMLIAFSLIYFAIISYRNQQPDHMISFGQSVGIGLLITAIASVMYVIIWLIIYYNFMPDYYIDMAKHLAEKARLAGKSQAEITKMTEEWKGYQEMFKNPLIHAGITITEPLPVGIVVTLISATIIRFRKQPAQQEAAKVTMQEN